MQYMCPSQLWASEGKELVGLLFVYSTQNSSDENVLV